MIFVVNSAGAIASLPVTEHEAGERPPPLTVESSINQDLGTQKLAT